MSEQYSQYSDEFFVNMSLNTEMELPSNRESVLHFFELIQKKFPTMKNFYNRDRGEYVLEEDKDGGKYRWTTVESKRISAGYVNPPSVQEAVDQHRFITRLLPYELSVSPLDCETLNMMYGFDFTYRGNHNELVAEALGLPVAFEKLSTMENAKYLSYEPAIQFALSDDCRTQCRLTIETRSTAYQVRTGEYGEDQISVYLTARSYGSLAQDQTFVDFIERLNTICEDIVNNYIIENVLVPLQTAIACK